MGNITDLSLTLETGWYAVPRRADATWAAELARELVDEAPAPVPDAAADAGATPGPPVEPPTDAAVAAALAEDLERVASVVAAAGDTLARAAVLVRAPRSGLADAMVAMTVLTGVGAQESRDDLESFVAESLEGGALHGEIFASEVPVGQVVGAHVVTVSASADVDALPNLEERVILAVAPAGSADLVEIVLLPDSMMTYPDAREAALDVAAGLEVQVGELA